MSKADKSLARLTKKKREDSVSKIRNERRDITTDLKLKKIIKEYHE